MNDELLIPVWVQQPNLPQTLNLIGNAPMRLTREQLLERLGIAPDRTVLHARENGALKVATQGAPTQRNIERTDYEKELSGKITRSVQGRLEREANRARKQHDRIQKKIAAEKLLEELGI